MMQTEHRVFGAALWLGTAAALNQSAGVMFFGAGLAAVTAGGILSPDVDQYKIFKAIFRWWPGKLDDYIFGHRRIAHWWGLPATAAILMYLAGSPWSAWALLFGWTTHLVGDLFFGKRVWKENIPAGIPFFPWWGHVGGLFRSHGWVASVTAYGVAVATVCWVMA